VEVLKQRQVSPYYDEVQPRIMHVLEAGHDVTGAVADAKFESRGNARHEARAQRLERESPRGDQHAAGDRLGVRRDSWLHMLVMIVLVRSFHNYGSWWVSANGPRVTMRRGAAEERSR
jgi:hypothetical protein